jgi:pyruvate,water dikinase
MTTGRVAATRPLAELRRRDEPVFGGKSGALGELLAAEIPVPPGFGVAAGAFSVFMEESGAAALAADVLARTDLDDVAAVGRASSEIGAAIRAAPIPGPVRDEIADRCRALGEDEPVAVRSSAVGEDSEEATFAGQQDSYLWVRGVDEVCEAVRNCWASLYSAPAIAYRARLGTNGEPAMGVTVQAMVDAVVSGVMFTCNPVSGDRSMVAVNASWGLGLAVVGGEVTPDDYLVSKITGEVVRAHINDKAVEYVPRPDGHGAHAVEVEPGRREARCLDGDALAALVAIARRIERHFGSHQDIEWVIARDATLPESVFVVQSRPVTAVGAVKPTDTPKGPPPSALSLVMSQFGAGAPRAAAAAAAAGVAGAAPAGAAPAAGKRDA